MSGAGGRLQIGIPVVNQSVTNARYSNHLNNSGRDECGACRPRELFCNGACGSREASPHGTFGQFPANFETPEHTHSHAYSAIVLKGEMTNPFEGQTDAPVMTAGSYWSMTAGKALSTACVFDMPCEFFMYSDEGFDFAPNE